MDKFGVTWLGTSIGSENDGCQSIYGSLSKGMAMRNIKADGLWKGSTSKV